MRKVLVIVLCIFCTLFCNIAKAQTYKEHSVAKGETVSSIAQTYGITTEALVNANPNLKNYCYVGMKLRIPENKGTKETKETKAEPADPPVVKENVVASNLSFINLQRSFETPAYWKSLEVKYHIVPKTEEYGMETSGKNLYFSGGIAYLWNENIHLDARIGYGFNSITSKVDFSGYSSTTKTKSHFIVLPLEVNYNIYLSEQKRDWFYLSPYIGADISLLLKATMEMDGSEQKIDPSDRLGFAGMLGVKAFYSKLGLNIGYEFNGDGGNFFLGIVGLF